MDNNLRTKPDQNAATDPVTRQSGSGDSGAAHLPWEVERTNIVLLAEVLLCEAETFVAACQYCSDFAEISFDYLLDAITGCDPSLTEYLLPQPARCPRCSHPIAEKTLIVPV